MCPQRRIDSWWNLSIVNDSKIGGFGKIESGFTNVFSKTLDQ